MLEDCTTVMDKKTAARITPLLANKGNGSEFKKSQDGSGSSKHFPRAPKKRETPGANTAKYDQSRKPQPQKSKVFDKRPRHRGQFYGGGKEDTKVGDETAEIGSVLGNGSKKVNLNHLLNFHYTPKDGGGAKYTQGRWLSNLKHKYNKEQYLQANCQFVVKATGDYSRYLNDPDRLVDWDLVEQIRVQSSELLSCPICLSSPTAARMTRCGHIYCWPCLLHYLALAEKSYSKCPICYEAIYRDDLKSVVALCHAEHSSGEMVTMRLMRRERGALVTVPVENALRLVGLGAVGPVSLTDNIENTVYSKLLVATTSQVYEILEREGAELTVRLQEEEHTPEICFTEQALELLRQRQSCLNREDSTKPKVPHIVEEEPQMMMAAARPNIVYESAFDDKIEASSVDFLQDRVRYESVSSESVDSATFLSPTADDLESNFAESLETDDTPLQQASSCLQPSKYVYFYQASDGQHMYLHPINARMLESTYGSLEASPLELKGRIVEKDSGTMTAELRHRLRHLQHLPVTCQFEVIEIEMRPPLLSPETLRVFRDQLDQRKRKRQKRARDERRREKHITEEENKKWGRYPSPKIKIESHSQFPECGMDNSPPNRTLIEPHLNLAQSSPPLTEEFEDLNLERDTSGGPSFAQMLREGKCQRVAQWPAPKQTGWPGVTRPASASDGEPDPEGYVPAPSFSQSFGDAFAQALELAAVSSPETKQDSSSSRKKKKPKQKVLLCTNMAYNSK